MADALKLMCILAHPDDESLGTGGIVAKYSAEGVETYLVTATRGEHGWSGPAEDYPGPEALGRVREGELRVAAEVLGLRDVAFLGYEDGYLDRADPATVTAQIAAHIRRVRPQVVVTFEPSGAYGHPDHIAICQFSIAAVVAAADPSFSPLPEALARPELRAWDRLPAHRVSKLYYFVGTRQRMADYQAIFGDIAMPVDGVERRPTAWEDWAITTRIDTSAHWQTVKRAIEAHRSQLPGYDDLLKLPGDEHLRLWREATLYRAFSLVNGGRAVEADLFEGIRD
ncbi:MAG TPA: PIG-L family deacetylase [Chloroflexia bacterium]|nr:PIG-L family deacetylase [Chloroflexia bacterium]